MWMTLDEEEVLWEGTPGAQAQERCPYERFKAKTSRSKRFLACGPR